MLRKLLGKSATDSKRDEEEIETAREVIKFVIDVRKTFIKKGSIHPNTLNSLSRITTGVNSGRFGFMNKTSHQKFLLITQGDSLKILRIQKNEIYIQILDCIGSDRKESLFKRKETQY